MATQQAGIRRAVVLATTASQNGALVVIVYHLGDLFQIAEVIHLRVAQTLHHLESAFDDYVEHPTPSAFISIKRTLRVARMAKVSTRQVIWKVSA
jgi:hypothetical protein